MKISHCVNWNEVNCWNPTPYWNQVVNHVCYLFMTQHTTTHACNKCTNVLTAFSHVCVMMPTLCVILHTHSAVVASVRAFFGRVGLTISVPEVGGGLRHVDRVTVTQIRALTPTVTRRVDTVTARWAGNTQHECCRWSLRTCSALQP